MSAVVIAGDTSGTVTLDAPANAGNTVLTLPATSGTVGLVSGNLGTPSALVGTNITGTANSLNAGLGVNQAWTDVNASRAIGTTYTNSTGKPIIVALTYTNSAGNTVQGLVINGVTVYASGCQTANQGSGFCLVVPNGATYVTVTNGGAMTKVVWMELR